MKYGAVIAVTGTSGRAARIRELGGGSFLGIEERIIQNFRSAGVGEIAVVAGPQKKLVRRLQNHGAVFLREKDPDAEMFTLVRRGLEYFKDRCEMIFICPESVPFFTEQTVRLMMEQTADVVICCSGGKKGHPVMPPSQRLIQSRCFWRPGTRGPFPILQRKRNLPPWYGVMTR